MTTTLKDVHDTLRQLISDRTIIVGHSADTDLKVCADYDITRFIIYVTPYAFYDFLYSFEILLISHTMSYFLFYSGAAAGTQSSD